MKNLLSKDLGGIFLLTTIYVIVVSFPNFHYSNHLNMIFLVASFLFTGYSLVAFINPEKNFKKILKKPVLILEFSVLITLIVSILLKFSFLGLHLNYLVLILSVIIMILSISAYIKRINYLNAHKLSDTFAPSIKKVSSEDENEVEVETAPKKSLQPEESAIEMVEEASKDIKTNKSKNNVYLNLIFVIMLSAFVIVSYLFKPLYNNTVSYYLGLLYMIFLVGYPVTYIIFPQENELNLKIRLLISFGISFPVTSLIGLPLYYSKYSFTATSTLLPLAILTLVLGVYAYKKRINAKND
jgi:uncharacterized membrane protein